MDSCHSAHAMTHPHTRPAVGPGTLLSVDLAPQDLGRRLDGVHEPLGDHGSLRLAAVMALILPGEVERLVLIERQRSMRSHGGQLAFPGGKPDQTDRDLVDTALRESEEEVGLDRSTVSVLGRLRPEPTPTGFFIVPFVGRVESGWEPAVTSEAEVARVLTPTLREVSDPSTHRITDVRHWQGRDYELHQFDIADPPLWGATARMVWDLLGRMGAAT